MTQISKNIFSKGLNRDYDPTNVSATSMVDNINGKLMFNKRGTLDWVEDNGNKLSFTLNGNSGADLNRYVPIGYAGNGNIKIIFSVRQNLSFSEIGILGTDLEGNGTYATLFNDANDPNNQKLNFKTTNQICARFLYENNETIRVYWVDGVETDSNPPRVFTIKYNIALEKNDVTAYSIVTNSVHSINSQSEFNIGIIKYNKRLSGSILTGVYQYTYRLLTDDGYATGWVTPTNKVFVTSDNYNTTNSNLYEMEGSGIDSGKGNRIEIKGVDDRYNRIQVAYLYSKTKAIVDESNIFSDTAIISGTTTMSFDHVANVGEPLITDTIAQRFQGIVAAKTLEVKDSVLYYGNIIENLLKITSAELETILSGLAITPKFRDMRSDTIGLTRNTTPLVNAEGVAQGTINKQMYNGQQEPYNVTNDYINYKGTQTEHLFTGYFRGETYRFAIVFYDKLGYPYFAFHLADFTFPDQYDTTYKWNRLKLDGTTTGVTTANLTIAASTTNDYHHTPLVGEPVLLNDPLHNDTYSHLRIMGIDVSGIDITTIKDKISGFSIVRTDRDATIINQGLIMPTLVDATTNTITRPHLTSFHRWDNTNPTQANLSRTLFNLHEYNGSVNNKYKSRPNQSVFYCPDYDFDETTIPTVQTSDTLKIVGSCYKAPNETYVQDSGGSYNGAHMTYIAQLQSSPRESPCVISKWYRSYNPYHESPADYFPQYGRNVNGIEYQVRLGFRSTVTAYEGNLDFHNAIQYKTGSAPTTEGLIAQLTSYWGYGKKNTLLYKHGNFTGNQSVSPFFNYSGGTSSLNRNTGGGSLIANYVKQNTTVYGGLTISSMQQTIFYSTGHFQPIGNSDFPEATNDLYNNIEVYGGDCYLDYFGFLRIYGRYETNNSGDDVSYGVVFPYESTINHTMRQASSSTEPMYPNVGHRGYNSFNSQAANVFGGSIFASGLFYDIVSGNALFEEFNYNDVLTFSELTKFFNTQPFAFQNVNEYPIRWRHTLNKYYGDPIDSWRQFEINSFEDLMGVYGVITSSSFLFNQIYSFQETGFGRLRAFDRAALESETTQSLTTGVGPALDGIDYISTSVGNQHQWSLVNTGKAFYWIDVFNGKAMRFAQDGLAYLSDLRGMHSYFEKESSFFINKDNPALNNGILGAWNSKDRDVYWTFNRDEYITYNVNFYIINDVIDASSYYGNNETVFVNWTGLTTVGNGLFLPVGNSTSGNNSNVIQYVSLSGTSNNMFVNQNKNGVITGLVQMQASQNYIFFRESENDDWQFTSFGTDKSKITPFRATVVYSEYITQFTQFHSFKPNFYICHNKFILSEQASIVSKEFYVHGQNLLHANYYGKDNKTSLTVTVSDKGEFAKLFDNIRVAINKQGVSKMDKFIFSTEQQKRFYNVQSDTRVRFLEDNFRLPIRTMKQQDRMRGRWLSMIFEFDNNTNYPIKIDNLINHYRLSNRR
tara:strand:- start:3499 stop:7842 length:4344 start_codon:yes stop_codon:yes gene_type:complete